MFEFGVVGAQAISLLLPILLAGIVLILTKKFRWFLILDKPIDFGSNLFGRNKTFRGVAIYLVISTLAVFIIHSIYVGQWWISSVYASEPLALGMIWSGFYVLGELINSFVKRRLEIRPGESGSPIQTVFDNVDGMLVSGIPMLFIYRVDFAVLAVAAGFSIVLHMLTDVWMRKLQLKQK